MFTAPKTKESAAGVGLSARVVAAFERQRSRQAVARAEWAEWAEVATRTTIWCSLGSMGHRCGRTGYWTAPRNSQSSPGCRGCCGTSPAPGRDVDAHRRSAAGAGVEGAAACHVGDHRGSLRAPHGGGGAGRCGLAGNRSGCRRRGARGRACHARRGFIPLRVGTTQGAARRPFGP